MAVLYADLVELFLPMGIDLMGEHRRELEPQFVELVEMGRRLDAREYRRDDWIRTEVFDQVQDVFDQYDLLVTPTLSVLPFDNTDDGGTLGPAEVNGQTVDPCIGWCLTYPINFTGHPAASVPCGFAEGLPVGMQIVGRRFADDIVLAASAAFERVRPWHDSYLDLEARRQRPALQR